MLFGWIEDEKYVDLVDESGKLFRRFKSQREYDCWASRFSPSDLKGLTVRESTVKWYDSNTPACEACCSCYFSCGLYL